MDKIKKKINTMVLFTMFVAIEAVLAFAPIGFIMIPPLAITLLHIPVIICSVIMDCWGWITRGDKVKMKQAGTVANIILQQSLPLTCK